MSAAPSWYDLADDSLQRELAIDPARSFIVQAPAGAGKTELLTQRFLALLGRVDEPEEIVALTFTNKAAAEMRHRILGSLRDADAGVMPAPPHRRKTLELARQVLQRDADRGWNLLQQAGRLQISTLDALCGRLARQMPLLSRLGSQPAVALDAEPLYREAARRTLQLLEQDHAVAPSMAAVLAHFDNDALALEGLLADMLARREQWLIHANEPKGRLDAEMLDALFAELVERELKRCAKVLTAPLQQALMPLARLMAAHAQLTQHTQAPLLACLENWTEPLVGQGSELPRWRALAVLLLTKDGLRKEVPNKLGLSKSRQPALHADFMAILNDLRAADSADVLCRIAALPDLQASAWEAALIGHLMAVLQSASQQLWLLFRERGQVDFTQIAQDALRALGTEDEPTDLLLQLDHRISHLLVDEFQDTSPTQLVLLERLMAGWQPGEPRSVFVVGDPMQSIYRFRKADVSLFLALRQRACLGHWPLTFLPLNRNNRSVPALVNWVNHSMAQVFPRHDDLVHGAVSFAPARPSREPGTGEAVCWHALIDQQCDDGDEALGMAEQEASRVLAIIRESRALRPDGTIAVLVRARTHLDGLLASLRDQAPDVAFQAVEIEPLAERQVIQDLVSLTRLLLHPADRLHGLAVLRAPWCGLLLEDLHQLAADRPDASVIELLEDDERLARLSDDGRARARQLRQVLRTAYAQQGRMRTRRWIEGVWQCLGGPACLRSRAELLDARTYLDLIDRLDAADGIDLDQLEREVERLYASADPSPDARRVQLMTIHKSKGLEFDTVILPGLHRKPANADQPLVIWDELSDEQGQEHVLVAPRPAGAAAEEGGASRYRFLQLFETARAFHEAQRLLYVAVTRAREHLHLVGALGRKADGTLRSPASGSLLKILWPVAQAVFERAGEAVSGDVPRATNGLSTKLMAQPRPHALLRLAKPDLHPDLIAPPHPAATSIQPLADAPATESQSLAADIGILVHRYLELIAADGLEPWSEPYVRGLLPAMQRWLQGRGHSRVAAESAAQEVLEQLIVTLRSEQGRWALQPRDSAASEWALVNADDDLRLNVIDRSFVEDGIRWIIDYKTTRSDKEPATQQAWREQLERYRRLFPHETVRLAVLLTASGELLRFD